jgi:hypothetical protein
VPVDGDNGQAQQQEDGDGASKDQVRSPTHTGPIIVLGLRRMQMSLSQGGNVHCSMFNCRLSSVVALRASFLKDAAPKAHPKMTTEH